jgi:hypothetical protein
MVVDQVNIAGSVRLFVVAENQPPVSGDGQAPESFQVAFERVQLPSWEPAELVQRLGGFEGEQKLAQLVGHRGRHPLGVAVFMELPQPFVAKANKLHVVLLDSSMYGYTVHVKVLEACTSTKIESGPDGGTRAYRIREFLHTLNLQHHLIAIDELKEGSGDLSQKALRKHLEDGIKAGVPGKLDESIFIPLFETPDGWRIQLTAYASSKYRPRLTTVMQESWGRTWNGPSYPLRAVLEKKASRYGHLGMPYVIAVNSSDMMHGDREFQDSLFGSPSQFAAPGSPPDIGFWGTSAAPKHTRVSAVLFTTNLCEATLLMGQVYACLYVNPWAVQPYGGVLANLPTFRLENGEVHEYPGEPLHKLLKLRLRDSRLWG